MKRTYYFGDAVLQEEILRGMFDRLNYNRVDKLDVEAAVKTMRRRIKRFYGFDNKYKSNGELLWQQAD